MSNQVWFITGASSGFGEAFARYAIAQGHCVVATARDVSKLAPIGALAPDRVLSLSVDVTRAGDLEAAARAALARFGRIDVLFNNAGYGIVGAVEETPESELRALMETNFFGAVAAANAVLPAMRKQKSGAIVNISSLGGQVSFAGFGAYSATKFALEGLSEAMAAELSPFGIKVLIVEPGAFRTSFAASALKHMPMMDAYRNVVGGTRDFARSMDSTQPGDPMKAAAAIAEVLAADKTPLRLQLGADSVDAVRAHAQTLLRDLETWEALARATTFDSEPADA